MNEKEKTTDVTAQQTDVSFLALNMGCESQGEPPGNTKQPVSRRAQSTQYYRWQFTLKYDDTLNESQLSQHLKDFCKEFYFQLEKGKEGEYLHWQGCFSLIMKERFETVKNHFPNTIHLEKAQNWFKLKNYSNKDETRVKGPFTHESVFVKVIEELRPWQVELWNLLQQEPEDRKILWIYDKSGNSGKTAFCKWAMVKHHATFIQNGKKADMVYAIKDPKIVLINFSRTNESHVNYDAIESVKDGILYSPKYESHAKIFNSPHVVIFSNFKPEIHSMSQDRWELYNLDLEKSTNLRKVNIINSRVRSDSEESL